MNRKLLSLVGLGLALMALGGAPAAQAHTGPAWVGTAIWGNSNLPPGGEGQFTLSVRNTVHELAEAGITITDELPPGVKVKAIHWDPDVEGTTAPYVSCSGVGTGVATCTAPYQVQQLPPPLPPTKILPTMVESNDYVRPIFVDVEIDPGVDEVGVNTLKVEGGGSPQFTQHKEVTFSSSPAPFGVVPSSFLADNFNDTFPFGDPLRQAGDHPSELRVNFDVTQLSEIGPDSTRYTDANGALRTTEVTLPRGWSGNPEAVPKCSPVDFANQACSPDTQVGYINLRLGYGTAKYGRYRPGGAQTFFNFVAAKTPIYSIDPPRGKLADYAFSVLSLIQAHIYPTIDPAQNYAVKTLTPDISNFGLVNVRYAEATFWGVPGDSAHDSYRKVPGEFTTEYGAPWGSTPIRPFLTNPMDCGFDNGGTRIRVDAYQRPGVFSAVREYGDALNVDGCDDPRIRFEPEISLQPTDRDAGGPTGLDVHLKVPQRNDVVQNPDELYAANGYVKGISTPPMKKVVVKFPEGMTINPGAAQGLESCSPAQIGLGTDDPVTCPDASQYGRLTLHTPVLPVDEQPEGFVYIAKQNDNPFHNFLSLYLVIQDPGRGVLVKIPGRTDLDPQTGQITTTFDDLPQFPVSDMEMNLKGGLRAGLVSPQTCGRKGIQATFYSWHAPNTPITVNSSFDVTQNPDGTPCFRSGSDRPFDPHFSGGTVNNLAGAFSPMELRMTRTDLEQELSVVGGTAPPGLLASIKGVGRCSDAAAAAAANPDRTGTEEIEHPSCPAGSQVGTVDAGTGVGQVLTYVKGKVYLAGPYGGAPLSGVAIVPAVAGPFDLGVIVTRAPVFVDPKTAELHVVTDKLPLIFKGVPVRVRDIQVHLDRQNFVLNPTNCAPFSLDGALLSSEGKSKSSSTPFQAAECQSLDFKPTLSARLFGGTHRGAHPKFSSTYRSSPGGANAADAVVTLPRSEFLDQGHIRTVCTRVQFAAAGGNGAGCPAASIYGHVTAKTPLLDEPLTGPVYLRSSDHKLPDLVAVLHGIVDIEVDGWIDSIHGGIRVHFESIPDAPVDQFTITMQGGKKGLLVNSRNICKRAYRIDADFGGQNGKEVALQPRLNARCAAKRTAKRHSQRHYAKRANVASARGR